MLYIIIGRWGSPTFSAGVFIGMVATVMSMMIKSVGDYYATARVCRLPAPPKHAINRGIAAEGLASLISGLLGSSHGTASYSEIVGFVAYTGVSKLANKEYGV